MEPITTAIISAITAGAVAGSKEIAKKALADGYAGIKALVSKKFGSNSEVMNAIQKLEDKPESIGRRTTLEEELKEINATSDPELHSAAVSLLDLVRSMSQGKQHIQQTAHGLGIAQATGGSAATVNIDHSHGKKDDV
jgi:uncharacterized sporulation protein YeaH/YhbH (DUF444 family)